MNVTRREFGRLALAGGPVLCAVARASRLAAQATAQAAARPNRSYINGVQFGLQPFCYHDLPMTPDNRGTLIKRLVRNGFGSRSFVAR